jgi:hypothetical protein
MTQVDAIERIYAQAVRDCRQDHRKRPNSGRRGQFKRGWIDAAVRGRQYREEALATLTWCNLGYRIGRDLCVSAPEEILQVWEHLARKYETER